LLVHSAVMMRTGSGQLVTVIPAVALRFAGADQLNPAILE